MTELVLNQYRSFWDVLPVASAAAPDRRRAILQPYAAEPELQSLLDGMRRQDEAGQEIYGLNVPRPAIDSLSQQRSVAVIRDCQDSSHSGVEAKATHEHVTAGTTRNLVVATMHLGKDGRWRVAFVTYPKSKC